MESAEKLRALYVGVTRAKSQLFIHCNSKLFNSISLPDVKIKNDPVIYPEPDEILSHINPHAGFQKLFFKYAENYGLFIEQNAIFHKSVKKQFAGTLWFMKRGKSTACRNSGLVYTEGNGRQHGYPPSTWT